MEENLVTVYDLDSCPINYILDIISGKWTVMILWEIHNGCNHFGELKRKLTGISNRTLALRLKMLEEQGILSRKVFFSTPPTVEYQITNKGLELEPILYAMRSWSSKYDNCN